jgi:hypothetical protein
MAASESRSTKGKSAEIRSLPVPSEGIPGGTVVGGRNASDALRVQRYRLSVESGASLGQSYDLLEAETRVGKAPENDIVLENPTVSRAHFASCGTWGRPTEPSSMARRCARRT